MQPTDGQRGGTGWNLDPRISRRQLLRGAAAAGLVVGSSAWLAACGGDEEAAAPPPPPADTGGGAAPAPPPPEPTPEPTPPAGGPVLGGRLRVGHVGGGKAENFNPALGSSFIDASRYLNLYDPLVRVNADLSLAPGLALEWTPNEDSTVWTLKLRPDVTWHDGKSFTADDVIYTFQSWADDKHIAHSNSTNMRLDDVKKLDDLTVELPLVSPNARLAETFTGQNAVLIQNGTTDFANPIGTGPFMFKEFTVGERSLCVKNPSYWDEGKPYVDEWEDISIDDNTARLNALLGGEIDMLSQLEPTAAKAHLDTGDIQVIRAPSTAIQVFIMAVDIPPFDDPLVRQAFRLIPDRQALIDGALLGFATAANDIPGAGLWNFASDLPPREQDLEQAKALLKQAGKENLKVTLHTSDIVPGFVEAATLFAEQAKGAGVTIEVKKEAANAYFDTSKLYTKLDFAQSFWTFGSLNLLYEQSLLSDAIWNETHWRDPAFDKLIRAAQGATDEATALDLWHQVQQIQYDQGGYIVWGNVDVLDAAANHVKGIAASAWFNLGGWAYRDVWLES